MMMPDQRAANVPPPEHRACTAELRQAITSALEGLPRAMRSVFVLREVEGLDTDETARSLGITSANVKVRLHRARGELRATLKGALGAEARSIYGFDGERCDRIVARVFAQLDPARWRADAAPCHGGSAPRPDQRDQQ